MKALQLTQVGKLDLIDTPVADVPPGYLLVRTSAAVICTSDIKDLRSNPFDIKLPVILGHEASGVVAALGSGVNNFQVNDPVATHPVHPCGQCDSCSSDLEHLCSNMEHFGMNMQGVFAEYFCVRADRARNAAGLSMEVAALAEPVCVCLEALAQAKIGEGGRLLIIGDGPFGSMIATLASDMGLSKVVVAGHHDFRLSFAGNAVAVNISKLPDPMSELKIHAGTLGYDAVILAVGNMSSVDMGLSLLRAKGRLVVFSAIADKTPVDLFDLHVRELEIVGACNDQNRFDDAMAALQSQQGQLEKLVTHCFPLSQYKEAFDFAEHGRETAMKVAFIFDNGDCQ